ncbi:hypothetical protein K491DRAFT_721501 [Lophiostoma macrostomum CBS 122681]|uniref:Uncharacterized protein n=1 Tax=Lophiostoma macrostomum CBS 122681 TaxID=1314788 RepID=A0A6A6SRH2_9PLEO|nr:hypothetical protein K491DRAFT_721501 [Lophiostoma macrostomum CBS 122681]
MAKKKNISGGASEMATTGGLQNPGGGAIIRDDLASDIDGFCKRIDNHFEGDTEHKALAEEAKSIAKELELKHNRVTYLAEGFHQRGRTLNEKVAELLKLRDQKQKRIRDRRRPASGRDQEIEGLEQTIERLKDELKKAQGPKAPPREAQRAEQSVNPYSA